MQLMPERSFADNELSCVGPVEAVNAIDSCNTLLKQDRLSPSVTAQICTLALSLARLRMGTRAVKAGS